MDINKGLAVIGYGLSVVGAGIGIGLLWSAYLSGAARQPEMANQLRVGAILGLAFVEALAILGFVLAIIAG